MELATPKFLDCVSYFSRRRVMDFHVNYNLRCILSRIYDDGLRAKDLLEDIFPASCINLNRVQKLF